MPTYLYRCFVCDHTKEIRHKMYETPEPVCEQCAAEDVDSVMLKMLTAGYTGVTRKTGDNNLSDWEETKYRHWN